MGAGVEVAVALLEAGADPLALGMTVNAGAEHEVVGADVRVTTWPVEVVAGHDSQTTIDCIPVVAALHG